MASNPFEDGWVEPAKAKPALRVVSGKVRIHTDIEQGSEQWLQLRCGVLTASAMKLILTPKTLKTAEGDKVTAHVLELAAQRITKYVEAQFVSDDMARGQNDEITARAKYSQEYAPVTECGFITNDKWGFSLGYSPDGLVGDDGLIECKSRRQRFQVQTICEGGVPAEYGLQLQTGLLVSERAWIDFISYSGGLPMATVRVFPDPVVQSAILSAAEAFERKVDAYVERYADALMSDARLIPTERETEMEMII